MLIPLQYFKVLPADIFQLIFLCELSILLWSFVDVFFSEVSLTKEILTPMRYPEYIKLN